MTQSHHRTWHWAFNKPAEAVWRVFADTARFNEAAGFPAHEIKEVVQQDGSIRYFAEASLNSYTLAWEEVPTNWIEYLWFTHERRFSKGPFTSVTAHVAIESLPEGCICHYTLSVTPANLLGHFVLRTGFFNGTEKKFTRMANEARAFVEQQAVLPFDFAPPVLAPGARERCEQLQHSMLASPYHHAHLGLLVAWILERPDADVWTLRPKLLAKEWKAPEREVIELFLLAANKGLLNLRWDLLCPNCRVGKAPSARMDEIPQGTHCPSCNIDYGRNFSRNVELVFQPSKSIRPLLGGEYCVFGPMSTPHIKVQLRVEPGQSRQERITLTAGTYRLRTLEPGNDLFVDTTADEGLSVIINADNQMMLASTPTAANGMLHIDNRSARHRTIIIEHREWMQDVLTAKEATTLQCFRDLFDENILRPGDHVEIDSVTLMFTDIKASTSLYERIGDAAAFSLVREHFAILAACVRRHDGTIVKTLGDSIMAAFNIPANALRCAQAIQIDFAEFNQSRTAQEQQVLVKLGLHMGPCIAVTLNGILDYYGKVANQTARLQSLSNGGDIVLSQTLADEAVVQDMLWEFTAESGSTQLKGISGDTAWIRVSAEALAYAHKHGA